MRCFPRTSASAVGIDGTLGVQFLPPGVQFLNAALDRVQVHSKLSYCPDNSSHWYQATQEHPPAAKNIQDWG